MAADQDKLEGAVAAFLNTPDTADPRDKPVPLNMALLGDRRVVERLLGRTASGSSVLVSDPASGEQRYVVDASLFEIVVDTAAQAAARAVAAELHADPNLVVGRIADELRAQAARYGVRLKPRQVGPFTANGDLDIGAYLTSTRPLTKKVSAGRRRPLTRFAAS